MASHHLTIAKAAFLASCLRPDEPQLGRDDVPRFYTLLDSATSKCSPSNVQACKEWLSKNILSSQQRTVAFGKYLAAVAKHVAIDKVRAGAGSEEWPIRRLRLHLLYLLNDVLHHAKYHAADTSQAHVGGNLQGPVQEIARLLRAQDKKRINRRLQALLEIWQREQYFEEDVTAQLRKENSGAAAEASTVESSSAESRIGRDLPFIMPATHGDPSMPYYDLPAANLMPHIVPNKPLPIKPDQVRALRLSAGLADESLVNAVKDFLKDVERTRNPFKCMEEDDALADMDELGQLSYRNEADETIGDTYYGWSKAFCAQMKRRIQDEDSEERRRGRSHSYSGSRGGSSSRSRTPSRHKKRDRSRTSSRSRSRQRLRSRSYSPPFYRNPPPFHPSNDTLGQVSSGNNQQLFYGGPPFNISNMPFPPPPMPLGPDGIPVIPPRPPHYEGIWPPPPLPPLPPPVQGTSDLPFPPQPQSNSSGGLDPRHQYRNR